jgi:predicted regulator of Ras-like GTPase activity (Roadblock/LC7/MglB family)
MPAAREPDNWPDTQRVLPARPARDDLAAPATQIVRDSDAYLGEATGDVGRRVSDDQVEFFVGGDAAMSLQAEFQRLAPEFIALHDVGLAASVRLLNSMVVPAGARVQRLSIRRQGQGVALAVILFVEVKLADDSPVRVYSTEVQADGPTRAALARVLLAHSRLGVLMVGELPTHALTAQLAPLHQAMQGRNWPNRDLLLVPLGSSIGLAGPSAQLAHQTPVAVHVAPHAAKPKHVWTFVGGAWNRLHGMPGGERALPTELSRAVPRPPVPATEAMTEPMPLESMRQLRPLRAASTAPMAQAAPKAPRAQVALGEPPAPAAPKATTVPTALTLPAALAVPPAAFATPTAIMPMPVPGASSWASYAQRCALVKGVQACCVFDMHSMTVMASSGDAPSPERLARQGAALLASMLDASRALGLGSPQPEAAISTAHHHLILKPVPRHPGVALHVVLQAHGSNLTLARLQLDRIDVPD